MGLGSWLPQVGKLTAKNGIMIEKNIHASSHLDLSLQISFKTHWNEAIKSEHTLKTGLKKVSQPMLKFCEFLQCSCLGLLGMIQLSRQKCIVSFEMSISFLPAFYVFGRVVSAVPAPAQFLPAPCRYHGKPAASQMTADWIPPAVFSSSCKPQLMLQQWQNVQRLPLGVVGEHLSPFVVGDMEMSHSCLASCQNLMFLAAGESSFISVLWAGRGIHESVNCSASKILQIQARVCQCIWYCLERQRLIKAEALWTLLSWMWKEGEKSTFPQNLWIPKVTTPSEDLKVILLLFC